MDPKWIHTFEEKGMPVNLSVKNVPDALAEQLRKRAKEHRRSLQGELLTILEDAVAGRTVLSPADLLARIKETGLETPEEAASFVREDRDVR